MMLEEHGIPTVFTYLPLLQLTSFIHGCRKPFQSSPLQLNLFSLQKYGIKEFSNFNEEQWKEKIMDLE